MRGFKKVDRNCPIFVTCLWEIVLKVIRLLLGIAKGV
jgi:hypothetical protein